MHLVFFWAIVGILKNCFWGLSLSVAPVAVGAQAEVTFDADVDVDCDIITRFKSCWQFNDLCWLFVFVFCCFFLLPFRVCLCCCCCCFRNMQPCVATEKKHNTHTTSRKNFFSRKKVTACRLRNNNSKNKPNCKQHEKQQRERQTEWMLGKWRFSWDS